MKYITLTIATLLTVASYAQSSSEKIVKDLHFTDLSGATTLMVANINGDIKISASGTDNVQLEATKTINAETAALAEKGKKEVTINTIDLGDTLILYIDGICPKFGKKIRETNKWDYLWNNCNCNEDWDRNHENYGYRVDFVLRVPSTTSLVVSTVNDGDIKIENVTGAVHAGNINGSIALKNISGETRAHTINGNVDLEYAKNPTKDCTYYTLNGDINANFIKGLAAKLRFESFNGDFYTNISSVEGVQASLDKKPTEKGFKYNVKGSYYRIGNGGVNLDFETFNGNLYLKEKTN